MSEYSEFPIGIALIVCDTIIEDKFTNKKSLIGLFGQIQASKLPHVKDSMSLLVSLTGGNGNYPCEIVCQHASIDVPVFKLATTVHFESPLQVQDLVFQIRQVSFPYPDQYWIKVLIDDIPIMMRPITLVNRDVPGDGASATTPQDHIFPVE